MSFTAVLNSMWQAGVHEASTLVMTQQLAVGLIGNTSSLTLISVLL